MRTAAICPTCATYTNAVCVIYDGPAMLANIPASPMDDMDTILVALNSTLDDINDDIATIQSDIIDINNTLNALPSPIGTVVSVNGILPTAGNVNLGGFSGTITVGLQTLTFTNGVLTSVV